MIHILNTRRRIKLIYMLNLTGVWSRIYRIHN